MRGLAPLLVWLMLALPAAGELRLPGPASQTHAQTAPAGTWALVVGPWHAGQAEALPVSGLITTEAWRLPGQSGNVDRIFADLARALADDGYDILFQCADTQCGGFDFRYALEVVGEPQMHVDLSKFLYLAAGKQADGGDRYAAVLASRSPGAAWVQITRVEPANITPETPGISVATPAEIRQPPPVATPLEEQFARTGKAVLHGLEFQTGSADLGPGPYDSLSDLADYLRAHPEARLVLVGHTDAQGALEANIALSKRRANAVRERLIGDYGVEAARLGAEGVGWLAPIASNQTPEGRRQNRRVEAVLTSTR